MVSRRDGTRSARVRKRGGSESAAGPVCGQVRLFLVVRGCCSWTPPAHGRHFSGGAAPRTPLVARTIVRCRRAPSHLYSGGAAPRTPVGAH